MSQESIKTLLDKINLLFNVFMKEGLDQVSNLEKELLKEQIQKLLAELDKIGGGNSIGDVAVVEHEPIIEQKVPDSVAVTFAFEEAQEAVVETLKEEEAPVVEDAVVKEVEVESIPTVKVEEVSKEFVREFRVNKPTRSLKEIIDLNKSFILKADLFKNNHESYTDFVTNLNELQSEEESVKLLESKAKELSWDTEDKAYELLLRAVERRFLPLLQQ